MRNQLVVGLLSVLLVPLDRGGPRAFPLRQSAASPRAQALTPHDSALHALNRLAYGPRPGEPDRVAAMGVMRWIDRQLDPARVDDAALGARESQVHVLRYDRRALAQVYLAVQRERRERTLTEPRAADRMDVRDDPGPAVRLGRRLAGDVADLVVVRAALSERQLAEVMADFWANRFNVFFGKGADRFLLPDYIEHTIRPHALGRFADLLRATAQSPAMLFYLDNWESVAPGFVPQRARGPRPRGLNENYARELLELHTLCVDGGYTEKDNKVKDAEGKISRVDYKRHLVFIEDLKQRKRGNKVADRPVDPRNVWIVRFDETDPKRKAKLEAMNALSEG